MAQTVRSDSHARSAAAHRGLTSLTYGSFGPANGSIGESYSKRFDLWTVVIHFRGRNYSGCDRGKDVARRNAFERAAELTGALVSEVQTEVYGDADCDFQDGYAEGV